MTNKKVSGEHAKQSAFLFFLSFLTRFILVSSIMTGSIYLGYHIIKNKPKARKKKKEKVYNILVETKELKKVDYFTTIETMGTVIPSYQIDIMSQVKGKITEISSKLIPGGIFKKKELITKIDKQDYSLEVEQKKLMVQIAQNNLRIEQGKQKAAKQEYKMFGRLLEGEEKDLILRKPYLLTSQYNIKVAQFVYKQALINLQRTEIKAPFNSIVLDKNISLGSFVNTGSKIANLVNIDEFWIKVSIPVDRIKWIDIPDKINQKGSMSKIINLSWAQGLFRKGYVKKLIPQIESKGRMVKLLIAVDDPLCLKKTNTNKPLLLLNSFVRVKIKGKLLKNVFRISSNWVHNGNSIWIKKSDNTLQVRKINIVWRTKNHVYVKNGIMEGEKIIINDLTGAVEGIKVNEIKQKPAKSKDTKKITWLNKNNRIKRRQQYE